MKGDRNDSCVDKRQDTANKFDDHSYISDSVAPEYCINRSDRPMDKIFDWSSSSNVTNDDH